MSDIFIMHQKENMSRIILTVEVILGILAISVHVAGGSILSIAVISPFLLIPLFPLIAASSVWPVKKVLFVMAGMSGTKGDEEILGFCEQYAISGAIIGGLIGCATLLINHHLINGKVISGIGKAAGIGVSVSLVSIIIIRQVRERTKIRYEKMTQGIDEISVICKRYGITRREKEIFNLIVGGNSNREIARSLDISEDTVRNHLHNIFDKTGVKNRNGLAGLPSSVRKQSENMS